MSIQEIDILFFIICEIACISGEIWVGDEIAFFKIKNLPSLRMFDTKR